MPTNYDIVSGEFGRYMDLVEQTANTLTTVKGNLDTALDLCATTGEGTEACADVAALTTHVNQLDADLTILASQNTTLSTFKTDIADKLDGVTGSSTDVDILDALQAQIDATSAAATEASNAIALLNTEIDGLEAEITGLEQDINIAISTISSQGGDITDLEIELDAMTESYNNQVTATENLQASYNSQAELLGDTQADLIDMQGFFADEEATSAGLTVDLAAAQQATADAITAGENALSYFQSQAAAATSEASLAAAADLATAMVDYDIALQNAEDAFDAALAELGSTNTALTNSLQDANGTIATHLSTIEGLNSDILGHLSTIEGLEADKTSLQANLDATLASLASEEGVNAQAVQDLADMTADWNTANTNYNETAAALTANEALLATSEINLATQTTSADSFEAQLATANNTISSQLSEIEGIAEELADAESELGQFQTLGTVMTTAIGDLEVILSGMGYEPVTLQEEEDLPEGAESGGSTVGGGFDGSGWSSFQGGGESEDNEFKQLLFRGIKARRAYLNMSGENGKVRDIDNDAPPLDFNADGESSTMDGLLKLGLFAGVIYLGSKLLKK